MKWHTNPGQKYRIKSTTSYIVVKFQNIKDKEKTLIDFRRKDRPPYRKAIRVRTDCLLTSVAVEGKISSKGSGKISKQIVFYT